MLTLGTMRQRKHNLPPGVTVDYDRHKNARFYFRRPGFPKIRLREKPGSDAFKDEVACARLGVPYKEAAPKPALRPKVVKDSLRWLVDEYERRNRARISVGLMDRRYRMLIEICESTIGNQKRGDLPYKLMQRRHVIDLRDTLRETPGAQNNVAKTLSAMFSWAVKSDLLEHNPCLGIDRLHSGDGFHTWTIGEVEKFEARHGPGTKARLALHLALFTGLRLANLAVLGRQHVRDGWLHIRPGKTAKSSGVTVDIPILPQLQQSIDESTCGEMTFLITNFGKPFSVNGLGNKFREWCDQAELPHCSAHGVRKAGATIAAENGATDDELMAIFGWTTKQQTTLYTRKASRQRLAKNAIHKLLPERNADKNVPLLSGVEESGTKTAKKLNENNAA